MVRRHLSTSDVAELRCHDHVVWCGDGPDAFDELAVSVFASAEDGELLIAVCDEPDVQRLAALEHLEERLEAGSLRLLATKDAYGSATDLSARRERFVHLVDGALAEGFSGVCVVADNSALARGSGEDFSAWLAWEAMADEFQARLPVRGICYFDRHEVPGDRLADLAVLHPVHSKGLSGPDFQLFFDGDQVRVLGALDAWGAERLARVLGSAPTLTSSIFDVSETEFVDHRALLILNQLAGGAGVVRIQGAKAIVRQVWELLDVPTPALEFC